MAPSHARGPAEASALDAADRRLLDRVQAGVPLVPRPFAAIAEAVGLGEAEVLRRLEALRAAGVLRQVGAIFDTARLGYRSALAAAVVPPERLETAAAVVGAHPGVSHDYERDFAWNLWFTLAVPPDSRLGLEGTAACLGRQAGCERLRLLPALRVFKIGVKLDMEEGGDPLRQDAAPGRPPPGGGETAVHGGDVAVVRALQEPLAFVPEPFLAPAREAGLAVTELLARGQALLGAGVMRRFAALLHHRRAGFTANAMGVWAVPEARVEEVGQAMAAYRAVSHCYQRPVYADWPYALFSMVHAKSREECVAVLDAIAAATGVTERAVLWTVREFKKVRLRYFTPDHAAWERAALEAA
jgi:DNA-binding Lrp family transcriptional regulator